MKSTRILLVLLAALSALALVAAGCGGDDAAPTVAEFEQSVVATTDRVDFAIDRITKADSKEEFLNRMVEAGVAIDAAATDFEETGFAEGFEAEGEKLGKALHALAVDLDAAASDIGNPAFGGLIAGTQALQFESWDNANKAIATMAGKGLEVSIIAPR
jgi:hypothetical protein